MSSNTSSSTVGGCVLGDTKCGSYGAVTGDSLQVNMIVDLCLGLLFYLLFVWFRSNRIYENRLHLPQVKLKPLPMDLRGFRRWWSWLEPVFTVPDAQLLESSGLDALVMMRILGLGIMIIAGCTLFGVGVLLPVYYTASDDVAATGDNANTTYFRMTMSNIPTNSGLLYVPFVYVYCVVAWVCWLLLLHYREWISLKQSYERQLAKTAPPTLLLDNVPEYTEDGEEVQEEEDPGGDDQADGIDGRRSRDDSKAQEPPDAMTQAHGADESAAGTSAAGAVGSATSTEPGEGSGLLGRSGRQPEPELRHRKPQAHAAPQRPHECDGAGEPDLEVGSAGEARRGCCWGGRRDGGKGGASADEPAPPVPPLMELAVLPGGVGLSSLPAATYAQRYTALVVDQTREQFSHGFRRDGKPYLWTLHSRLRRVPGKGARGLAAVAAYLRLPEVLAQSREQVELDARMRMRVAEHTFRNVFGADMHSVVPIYDSRPAQAALLAWEATRKRVDWLQAALEAAQTALDAMREQEAGEAGSSVDAEAGSSVQTGSASAAAASAHASAAEDGHAAAHASAAEGHAADGAGSEQGAAGPTAKEQPSQPGFWALQRQEWSAGRRQALHDRVAKLWAQLDAALIKLEQQRAAWEAARAAAATRAPLPAFFVTFYTQQAAFFASRVNANPEQQRLMTVLPGIAPEDVNYAALERTSGARNLRPMVALLPILFILLLPVGLFSGICGTIVILVCQPVDGEATSSQESWFCSDNSFAAFLRQLISGFLPALLLTIYQAAILPPFIYACAQAESTHFSLSALDRRCATLFFHHDVWNIFLGGLLGGSIAAAIRAIINDWKSIFTVLGDAIPASSNFFINYVLYQSFTGIAFRLWFPCGFPVVVLCFKVLRLVSRPATERGRDVETPARNMRTGRDLGVNVFCVYVISLAYAPISPIILPFALLYFAGTWACWRYQLLFVYQPAYDLQGNYWPYAAHRVLACLAIQVVLTGAVLAVKGAYVGAGIMIVMLCIWITWFDRYLRLRYDSVVVNPPLAALHSARRLDVDERLYTPPPLRECAEGWHPEWGKAWQWWGSPRYGF